MSRGERWVAAVIALALAGCMRIYPDPELPDVLVEWFSELECQADSDRVVVSLTELDPEALVDTVEAPCRDTRLSFPDVARVRYSLAAELKDGEGDILGAYETEVDLRDGLSERVNPFFGRLPGTNFRVSWTFDMGATCSALGVGLVFVRVSAPGEGPRFGFAAPCKISIFNHSIPMPGIYTLSAAAQTDDAVVARSPESAPMFVGDGSVTEFGTLVMSPCSGGCPE